METKKINFSTPRYKVDRELSSRGSKHWKSVLTEDDVRLINALLNEGMTQIEIARKFEVKRQVIHNIARGRSWRHVT